MNPTPFALLTLCVAVLAPATAAECPDDRRPQARTNGEHPAVLVQRLAREAGYDYASKFYPHPAWLYLREAPPEPTAVARSPEPVPVPRP
ncbi:MAG: hypothetical protein KF788_20750 [Piscinibacter sp.]|nr:hypothetical protein [Piscinibacter sp.]